MSVIPEDQLEKKLLALNDTIESIASLSSWCLERPHHHQQIVNVWLQVLMNVKLEQRVNLFHLANDVIQYSKRKGFSFVESWRTALQQAIPTVRDDKIRPKIERLFEIWDERAIYDKAFLVDLTALLNSHMPTEESQDFDPITLISKIRACKRLEDDTDLKIKVVRDCRLPLNDVEALHAFLKVRRHGEDVEQELEESVGKMVDYITALQAEIKDRAALIDLLDTSDTFYNKEREDAEIVFKAYRNFKKRVDNLKRKLDDVTTSLPSPMLSVDMNAHSPESELNLPTSSMTGKHSRDSPTEEIPQPYSEWELLRLIRSPSYSPPPSLYEPPTPPCSFERHSSPKYRSPPSNSPKYQSPPTNTLLTPSSSSSYTISSHSNQPDSTSSSYTRQEDSINDSPYAPPLVNSGFSSFMGNSNSPFDFQATRTVECSSANKEHSPDDCHLISALFTMLCRLASR